MSSKENLRYWQERASENSDTHLHRAKSGPIELPVVGIGPAVTKEAGGTSGQGLIMRMRWRARIAIITEAVTCGMFSAPRASQW